MPNLAMNFYDASFATNTPFRGIAPAGKSFLPFQHAGIHYALTQIANGRNVMLGDVPGLGKTIQAVGILNFQDLNPGEFHLVVCPASLIYNWQEEVKAWAVFDPGVFLWKSAKTVIPSAARVVITSYNIASSRQGLAQILKRKIHSLIMDEAHALKTPSSLRTRAMFGGKQNVASRARHRIMLTGTPIPNRVKESYALIRGLDWDAIDQKDFFKFALRYCGAFQDEYGTWDFNGSANTDELGRIMRERFMVRRSKKSVLPQLPDKFPALVFLPTAADARRLLRAEALYKTEYEMGRLKGGETAAGYEGLATHRRELGESKVAAGVAYLEERLEEYEKIVVFVHHKSVFDSTWQGLAPYGIAGIKGGDSLEARHASVQRFQNDPACRVFLVSILAGGTGLTLTAAHYVGMLEYSWAPEDNNQAIDRLHRIGQTRGVVVEYLCYRDSLDCIILRTNISKQRVIDEVLN